MNVASFFCAAGVPLCGQKYSIATITMTDLEVRIINSGVHAARIAHDDVKRKLDFQVLLIKNIFATVFAAAVSIAANLGKSELYKMSHLDVVWVSLIVSLTISLLMMVRKTNLAFSIALVMNYVIISLILYCGMVPISFPSLWIFPLIASTTMMIRLPLEGHE